MEQLITDLQAEIEDAKMRLHAARCKGGNAEEIDQSTQFLRGLELAMRHVKYHVHQHEICCPKHGIMSTTCPQSLPTFHANKRDEKNNL